MCLALSKNWIIGFVRVSGSAVTRRRPFCTTATALGSRNSHPGKPPITHFESGFSRSAKPPYSMVSTARSMSVVIVVALRR